VSGPEDLLRRYVEQREAMGEGQLVLEQPVAAARSEPAHMERPGAEVPSTEKPATASESSQPSIPTGIAIQPPSTDLFAADDLSKLDIDQIAAEVSGCKRCRLSRDRNKAVPGEGPVDARLVVVGEGPGAREDETGRPFVGRAGELLTEILKAIDLERDRVFICNIVKCRPPSNRTPQQNEIDACVPFLHRQLDIVQPKVILAMGSTAITTLLQRKQSLGAFRGKLHSFRGVPLVATYHPAALLRNPNWKRPTWDDVRIARRILDE